MKALGGVLGISTQHSDAARKDLVVPLKNRIVPGIRAAENIAEGPFVFGEVGHIA